MSTRSGKRIHSSFEIIQEPDTVELKSEKKTRTKRRKDNTDESNANAVLNETAHYVHYPGDEAFKDNMEKSSRKLRRHTLKEPNAYLINSDANVDTEKSKNTRKSKRFLQESQLSTAENNKLGVKGLLESGKSIKKNKKKTKKQNIVEPIETITEDIKENVPKNKKKSKRKKHLKKSPSLKDEDVDKENISSSTLNKSNASIESFHSAAGSPESFKSNAIVCTLDENILSDKDHSNDLQKPSKKSVTPKVLKRKSSTLVKDSEDDDRSINEIVEQDSATKRRSYRTRKSMDQTTDIIPHSDIDYPDKKINAKKIYSSFDSSDTKVNVTFENSEQHNNSTPERTEEQNSTFDKSNPKLIRPFEISDQKLNETFEASSHNCSDSKFVTNGDITRRRKCKRKSRNTNKKDESDTKYSLNTTFEKSPNNVKLDKTKSLDATFDKESGGESLPSNDQIQITNGKSDSLNATFDKSTNNSHISINSDDSKTENIINTTPQIVESSIEESSIHISPKLITPVSSLEKETMEVPITPLTRESTYIKDSPKLQTPKAEEPATPKSTRLSMNVTPNRRKSLPSPGRTPFMGLKTSEKKNNVLNVTHSIEKSVTRASLVEPMPRTTKVMFCSPINSPALVSQMKRKVIKSNLKGSNKSFVFDESMSETSRSMSRKRSYTQSEADTVQRKRTRIGEEMQLSVDRLSRPRTVSATGKLSEPSTPSKNKTPTKPRSESKVSRTKLPNFAALHQKRFEKMESLDECQERKAKRARQLLTPTGSVNLMERVSPKDKETESPKTSHAKEPKKHTLESLNPGYNRFGFKMNCGENPFIKKTEVKKAKPNGLTRATLPSLAGTTSQRREAAKQTVMREKSFTEKRDTNRKENRTIIKGVRTNRRFELQMKMRNIDA